VWWKWHFGVSKAGLNPKSTLLLAVQPWAESLTSLSLRFLIWGGLGERVPAPTADGYDKDRGWGLWPVSRVHSTNAGFPHLPSTSPF